MRCAAAVLLLGGCALYTGGGGGGSGGAECSDPPPGCVDTDDVCSSECLGVGYSCVDGQWRVSIECDPGPIAIEGTIEVYQRVASASASCPNLTPHATFTWTVVDGMPKTLTAPYPIVVTASSVTNEGFTNHVHVEQTDDWGNGVVPSIVYDLPFDTSPEVSAPATGTLGDCTFTLDVSASIGGA